MKKENEEIIVEELCKEYYTKRNFVTLLYKICKDSKTTNIKEEIERYLKRCVKRCVKKD